MLYFLILPAFALWLLVATVAMLLCNRIRVFKPAFPFVWRASLWSSVGIVVANALLIAAGVLGLKAADRAPQSAGEVIAGLSAAGLLVGPLFASVAGWVAGLLAGSAFALRQRKVGPNN